MSRTGVWANTKPLPGQAAINWAHPLAQSMCGCFLMEPGYRTVDLANPAYSGVYDTTGKKAPGYFGGECFESAGIGNSYITVDGTASRLFVKTAPFTLLAWVRIRDTWSARIMAQVDGMNAGWIWQVYSDSTVYFYWRNGGGSSYFGRYAPVTTHRDKHWHQMAITYSGGGASTDVELYFDGAPHLTTGGYTASITGPSVNSNQTIGGTEEAGSESATDIDHVLTWHRCLTREEIADLYAAPFAFLQKPSAQSIAQRTVYFVPVGTTVTPSWDVHSTVAPTWPQTIWSVYSTVAPTWPQTIWSVRTVVAPTWPQTIWGVFAAIDEKTTLRWDCCQLVNKSNSGSWDVRAAVAQSSTPLWDVAALVGKTVDCPYQVRATLASTSSLLYSVHALCQQSLGSSWDVLSQAGNQTSLLWNVLRAIASTTSCPWDVLAGILADVTLTYNIRSVLGKENLFSYHVRQNVTKSAQPIWDVLATLGKERQNDWDVLANAAVAQLVNLEWNLRTLLSKQASPVWKTRALLAKSQASLWNTQAAIQKNTSVPWQVRQLLHQEDDFLWKVLGKVSQEKASSWHTRTTLADAIALLWSVGLIQLFFDQSAHVRIRHEQNGLITLVLDDIATLD